MRLHPTILIGYGRYGLRVLQSLLAGAAARGSLLWDESFDVAGVNVRRLSTMALFWIPDVLRLDMQRIQPEEPGGDDFEMMQDLYQQIEPVHADEKQLGAAIAERVEQAKARLFNEVLLSQAGGAVTLGLDVIVIAQPSHEGVLGKLREILAPAMERLAADPGLIRPAPGQDLLNFIALLDFDDYWNPAPAQRAVREALQKAIDAGREATELGKPAFGRIYLVDGRTERGNHDDQMRLEETVLFLDLLLFEGHRSGTQLRFLYQREEDGVPPVCTFGVRGVELSTGRRRKLAAASFARGLLEHLASGAAAPPPESPIERAVRPFLAANIDATLGRPEMEARKDEATAAIRDRLLQLDVHAADWPALVARECDRQVDEWSAKVAAGASARLSKSVKMHLASLRGELVGAIAGYFANDLYPQTVGSILAEIDRILAILEREAEPGAAHAQQAGVSSPAVDLDRLHRSFHAFREGQVETNGLKNRWWPMLAIVAALAFGPLARDVLAEWLGDDWARGYLQTIVSTLLAGLSAWVVGAVLVHPKMARKVQRALNFYTHPERGRFSDSVRRLVLSELVRGRIERQIDILAGALRVRMLGEAIAELRRLREPLAERKREIEWLDRQLRDYLNLHGVDASGELPRYLPNRRRNHVLRSIESDEDLALVARPFPRRDTHYQDALRRLNLLDKWDERYLSTFLDPHHFLDRLAELFPAPEWTEQGEIAERWATGLASGLRDSMQFPVSFFWYRSEGLAARLEHCSVPSHWLRLSSAAQLLRDGGFHTRLIATERGERVYLLRTQSGVRTELLKEPS